MKYAYKDKKTYKLQHKLKLLLTILLAVLISTTGYIISKNAFSTPTDNGLIFIEENSRGYTITITASNIPLSGVELYDGSDNLIGTTNSLGVIDYSDANLPVLDYLIIDNNTITLTQENPNNYTFSYTMPLVGEAYAEFDSSNGQLKIFRDTAGLYTNNQVIGTKTYYTGIETITDNVLPRWYSNRANITTVVIEDYFRPKTAYHMFEGCVNLTKITGMSNLDTSSVTDMGYMFYNCKTLTALDVSNLNTSNVTTMNSMFDGCKSLTTLDVSNLNTSNVITMVDMFNNCTELINIDLTGFDTSKVTNMNSMFYNCTGLINLDLTGFDTSKVTDMSYMFVHCEKLTSINVNSFNTYNVTKMDSMFRYCVALKNLDLSSFDTSNVTTMSDMFEECNNLTNLDISNFNTSNVTDMSYMFNNCEKLINLNLNNFDTSNVTNMRTMFGYCKKLVSLNISNFNTSKVTDMYYMFYNCFELTTLDLSNFNTSNVTNMETMFGFCKNLTNLDLSKFNTSNVTSMAQMFYGCDNLTYLNLSSFDTSNTTSMSSIFSGTSKLNTLILGTNWNFLSSNGLSNSWKRDGDNTIYTATELTANYVGSTMAGIYRRTDVTMNAILYDSGELVFQIGSTPDKSKGNVTNTYTGFDSTIYGNASSTPWYSKRTSVTTITFKDLVVPASTAFWFYEFSNLTKIKNLENLDTSNVASTQSMFNKCSSLKSFDLNKIKTNNLTNMSYMFYDCTSLQSLNMSNFKAEILTNVADLFTNTNLKTLTLGSQTEFNILPTIAGTWKRDGDTTTTYTGNQVFAGPAGVYREQSSIVYAIVYNNGEMVFQEGNTPDPTKGTVLGTYTGFETGYYTYSSIPWSSVQTSVVKVIFNTVVTPKSTRYWFYKFSNLIEIENIELLNTENATTMNDMFYKCEKLTNLDLSSFNTEKVTDMSEMFRECKTLETLDISSFNTSKCSNFSAMFYNCNQLLILDVSNFNTSKATSFFCMFFNCYQLKELDVSGFDTSNSYSFNNMFADCRNLLNLDVSGFSTSKANNISGMFQYCVKLKEIDVSGFDTSNVEDMSSMFTGCSYLKELDLSNFNTGKVGSMSSMFAFCDSLKKLDIENFNTSEVIDMSSMFTGCSNLEELDLSNFNTSKVETMNNMFSNCIFLTDLNISNFNTTQVTDMIYMFGGCGALTVLDISNFDTGSVTSMLNTFKEMYDLKVIKLGTNWNFLSSNGLENSWKRDGDNTVYTAAQLTSSYNGATMAGIYRRADLTKYAMVYDTGILVFQEGNTPDISKGTLLNSYTGFESVTYTTASSVPWYTHRTLIKNVTFETEIIPASTAYWFYEITGLNKFNNIFRLNTSLTITTQSMFENCTSLVSFNMKNIKTNHLTNMNSMFKGCVKLQSLNMSNFEAEHLTTVTDIFTNTGLKKLTLGNQTEFNILPTLSGAWKRDGNSTTYAGNQIFYGPAGVYRLTTSNVYAIVYDNGEMVFQEGNTPDPTKGNVLGTYTGFETTNYTASSTSVPWGTNKSTITKIIFETEVSPISTYAWFQEMINLIEIENIEYLNTESVTNMAKMFYGCTSLTVLDLSTFDTSNVTNMTAMFDTCKSLTSLEINSFDTSKVVGMNHMFNNMLSIVFLDVSSFDTSNVTDMNRMFAIGGSREVNLITIFGLENFDTSNVTDMNRMFAYQQNLRSIDVCMFDTSKVTNMSYMFTWCRELEEIDVSSFDTSNVTTMSNMFSMPTTADNDLTEIIGIDTFDTSNVTDMSYMFNGCQRVTELDLSNFDTSNVTAMSNMFTSTTKLNTLKLGTEWNFLSNNGLTKSWVRDGDTTRYTAAELTANYNGSTMAGTYRAIVLLTITETVKGTFAMLDKNFTFTINVQKDGVGINTTHAYTGSKTGNLVFSNGNATFTLKHGENISTYLPYGNTYSITQDSDGYTLSSSYASGTLNNDAITSSFTDTLNGTPPTGIFQDLTPFIILIIFTILGIFLIKKFKYI